MKEPVLKLRNMTKIYGGRAVVDHVNMDIQKGDIYGLIGKNGAGKTTLIRMITSLIQSDEGQMELFGRNSAGGLAQARKRVSSVVESPALYPNLTAEQNLEYYRILYGIPDRNRVQAALEMVNLTDTGQKKYKNFSLGMKQRLGLALAILGNPDFILLDEPINGLDPIGIMDMRKTLKNLNEQHGITILISSHILSELSLLGTRYGIIDQGKMVKQITDSWLKEQCQKSLSVVVDDLPGAAAILETTLKTQNYKTTGQNEIRIYDYLEKPSEVAYALVTGGIGVSSLHEVGDNLEDYFKALIGEGQ